jgi:hypothetical protein
VRAVQHEWDRGVTVDTRTTKLIAHSSVTRATPLATFL